MEKRIEKPNMPRGGSIEELARFWDTHDLTDFEGQLEEVPRQVFVRTNGTAVTVSLQSKDVQRLKKMATAKGVKDTTLIRQWIVERLHSGASPTTAVKRRRTLSAGRKR